MQIHGFRNCWVATKPPSSAGSKNTVELYSAIFPSFSMIRLPQPEIPAYFKTSNRLL